MEAADYKNLLIDAESVSVEGYLSVYAGRICQDSEKLFVSDFLFPLFGASNIKHVVPQYPFIDWCVDEHFKRITYAFKNVGGASAYEYAASGKRKFFNLVRLDIENSVGDIVVVYPEMHHTSAVTRHCHRV